MTLRLSRRVILDSAWVALAAFVVIRAVWTVHGAILSNSSDSAPRLVVTKSTHDLGSVPVGKPLRASFVISNTGSRRLVMRDASDCCSQRSSAATIIPAGSSEKLEVVLDAPMKVGPIEYLRVFETNDPRFPNLSLTLRAVVQDPRHARR